MLHSTDMAIFIIQDVHDVVKMGELGMYSLLLTPTPPNAAAADI